MVKNILRNLNVLNAALMILLALFIHSDLMPRLGYKAALTPKAVAKTGSTAGAAADKAGKETGKESDEEAETKLVPQEYKIISDMNLFHPDRKIVKFVPPAKQEEKLPPPDFVLYGTIITDSVKIAYIEDRKAPYVPPGGQQGGQKRSRQMKVGDTLSGFTVKEIDHEKVIMARNTEEIVLKKSSSSEKPAVPGQPYRPTPTFPRRGGMPYQQTQPQPAAPAAAQLPPPTIITVPAVTAQPAAPSQPAASAPKTQTQPPQKLPTQQQQQPPPQRKY